MPALNRGFASLTAQSHRHVGNRWSLYVMISYLMIELREARDNGE
jgi:hypothetical protein